MASPLSSDDASERLRKIREEGLRCSEEVVEIWEDSLADNIYKLGDEAWLIYEQVCLAALDCARLDIAIVCIDSLKNQFQGSLRVQKLEAMKMESLEQFGTAEKIYRLILKEDETNSIIRKRLIALKKAQNAVPEAIKELNDYLKHYCSDYEAWMELCDLYIREQDYSKACFCMEELIMSNPHNHLFHQRYAEIKYTQGGQENMEVARGYFAQAIKLNPTNMRALYGMFMAATFIASSSKSSAKVKRDNIKYAAWAAQQINSRYESCTGKASKEIKTLESMLSSLQVTQST